MESLVLNAMSLQLYLSLLYIFECLLVCLFVCLFAVNAKTTKQIDAHEFRQTIRRVSFVRLKSSVLVLARIYRNVSGFSFAADRHFYLSPFHFWLLPRCLMYITQSALCNNSVGHAPHRY